MSHEDFHFEQSYPSGNISTTAIGDLFDQSTKALTGHWTNGVLGTFLTFIIGAVAGLIPFVGNIAGLVLGSVFSLGWAIWSLNLLRRGEERLDDVFAGFSNFGGALAVGLLASLIISIPFLLIIIPLLIIYSGAIISGDFSMNDVFSASDTWLYIGGFVLIIMIIPIVVYISLIFALCFFILADHPNMPTTQILRQSQRLMEGNKRQIGSDSTHVSRPRNGCYDTVWAWPALARATRTHHISWVLS